jgi:glycine/D-amino acid oxidase-like deaminating enzyme
MTSIRQRVAVVGAGIFGACVAYYLARAGDIEVFLLERSHPAQGTTAASYCRLSVWGKQPDHYFLLNHAGMRQHTQLAEELGEPSAWHQQCGALLCSDESLDASFREECEQAVRLGYAIRPVDDPVRIIGSPSFVMPGRDAVYLPEEGWADAPTLTRRLVDGACAAGATLFTDQAVTGLKRLAGSWLVQSTDGDLLRVDAVVSTAGIDADRVASFAGHELTLAPTQGLLLEVGVPRHGLRCVVHTPALTVRLVDADRLLLRAPWSDGELGRRPDRQEIAAGLPSLAAKTMPWLGRATILTIRVSTRVSPSGGFRAWGRYTPFPAITRQSHTAA